MKKAVVFYSLDGSTKAAAGLIAQSVGADIFELEESRPRKSKPMTFVAGGFGALTGARSRLKENPAGEMDDYDCLYIGSPIWASHTVPAVNTFVSALKAQGKQVVLFTVQADPDTVDTKGVQKLAARLGKRGAAVKRTIALHGAPPGETADTAHLARQLDEALRD